MKYLTYLLIFLVFIFSSCKKETPPSKYFAVSFWTDRDGYPLDITVTQDYGQHFDPIDVGTLNTYINGPITNCSSPNGLRKIIKMETGPNTWGTTPYYHDYFAESKSPFYFGEGYGSFGGTSYKKTVVTLLKLSETHHLKKLLFGQATQPIFRIITI